MYDFTITTQAMSLAEWRAAPDCVKAGVFEEITELREQDRADQHWAWPFVQPFFDHE
ncbi:MAG: hypothetical protein ISP90_12900 [Nevskia sp.]|nr:hypothetical protein [Nevskia sp.]